MRVKHEPGRDRDIHKVLHAIADLTAPEIARAAEKAGGSISATSIYNWRRPLKDGGVRYPQHEKLQAAAAAVGMTFAFVSIVDQKTIEARYQTTGRTRKNGKERT